MNLDDDFAAAKVVEDGHRWDLERAGTLEVWATFAPPTAPAERFSARLLWKRYPDEAPSLKFRDLGTGRIDIPRAWPQLPGFRPGSCDACVSWTSEGAALHPEWAGDPKFRWDPSGNVLLKVLRTLADLFETSFQGRHP
jgi:hypothetical protein